MLENLGETKNPKGHYADRVKFSVDDVNIIDLTKDNELSRRIGKTKGAEKYKKALHRQLK